MTTPGCPDPGELAGRWGIERELSDLRAGIGGEFHGALVITPAGDGYDWIESGALTWGSYTGPAERRLHMSRIEREWWMTFEDGRPFHPWRYNTEVEHPCVNDLYRGTVTYDARVPDRFEVRWDVTGPTKRQRIVSRMRRTQAGVSAST